MNSFYLNITIDLCPINNLTDAMSPHLLRGTYVQSAMSEFSWPGFPQDFLAYSHCHHTCTQDSQLTARNYPGKCRNCEVLQTFQIGQSPLIKVNYKVKEIHKIQYNFNDGLVKIVSLRGLIWYDQKILYKLIKWLKRISTGNVECDSFNLKPHLQNNISIINNIILFMF